MHHGHEVPTGITLQAALRTGCHWETLTLSMMPLGWAGPQSVGVTR